MDRSEGNGRHCGPRHGTEAISEPPAHTSGTETSHALRALPSLLTAQRGCCFMQLSFGEVSYTTTGACSIATNSC